MTKRIATLMLAALCFCGASGALALRIAWATPPIGVVSTTLSGPVEFGHIHLWSRTPTHLVRIQAEGQSDVYVVDVKIAPGPRLRFDQIRAARHTLGPAHDAHLAASLPLKRRRHHGLSS
jgi:hypothetical protein